MHGSPCCTNDVVPETLDLGVRGSPLALECLNFLIGEFLRLEFPPGPETAHVSKRKIAGLADAALRRALGESARRLAEYLAGSRAVGLVTGIVCSIEAAVGVELPLLLGDPCQHATFDAAEIRADQHMPMRCTDQ